jgi:hypothetical protein
MSSLAERASSQDADLSATACFSVSGEPSPGLMPRILELFAKRGVVPDAFHGRVADGRLSVEVRATGLDEATAAYIGRCLRQIHLVERVLVSMGEERDGA